MPCHLLSSICAIGSRLSTDVNVRAKIQDLANWSRILFSKAMENFSLETVQTCILLANICAADLQPEGEALYFGKQDWSSMNVFLRTNQFAGMANRMAQVLGLNQAHPADGAILREIKARVWWTLVMADYWCSAGLGIPRQLSTKDTTAPLPIDESAFHQWQPDQAIAIRVDQFPLGLWAHMINLVKIFGPIHDLNRRLAEEHGLEDWEADDNVRELADQLDLWVQELPPNVQLTDNNLYEHETKGLGGPFVALHLGYHHYSTLLYFRYLDIRAQDRVVGEPYARRCRQHALSFSRLLQLARERKHCEAVYPTVGHMAIVSSSVLIHSLLFGQEDELSNSKTFLMSNFAALVELKKFWPCLERTVRSHRS